MINITGTQLSQLTSGTFSELPVLRVIDLRENALSKIDPEEFLRMGALREIYLAGISEAKGGFLGKFKASANAVIIINIKLFSRVYTPTREQLVSQINTVLIVQAINTARDQTRKILIQQNPKISLFFFFLRMNFLRQLENFVPSLEKVFTSVFTNRKKTFF